jgi:hypothetical protein
MSKFHSDQYFDGETSNEATNLTVTAEHFCGSADSFKEEGTSDYASVTAQIAALPTYWGDTNSGKIQDGGASVALSIHDIGDQGYYWTMYVAGQYMKTLVAVVRHRDFDGESNLNNGINVETNLEEIRHGLFDDQVKCVTAYRNLKEELNVLVEQILLTRTETLEKITDYVKIDPSLYSTKASNDILIREGICQHAAKFPVVRNYHLDYNNLDKVQCDRLHMKYDENHDRFILCDCLKNFSMKRKREAVIDENGKENEKEYFELEANEASSSPTFFEQVQLNVSSMQKQGTSSSVVNSSSHKRKMYCSMCSALKANLNKKEDKS